jgi:hypothetical protein
MKKKLNISELKTIEVNATVLRACNVIPFMLANKINGLAVAVMPGINNYKDQFAVLNDRKEQIEKLSGADQETALKKNKEDFFALANEKYEVEIIPIPLLEFTGLEITGEKDAIQAAGNKVTFSYRDAYFDLQKAQVIV